MSGDAVKLTTFSDAQFLGRVQDLLSRSITRLSSGSRLVTPADDPQAVGESEKLGAQNRRTQAASTNVQNAISLLQAKDGFLSSMGEMITRMSELAQLSQDVMKNGGDVALYQTEFSNLQAQLRDTIGGTPAEIGGTTAITKPLGTFNGIVLFGSNPGGMSVASGAESTESITIPESNLRDGNMLQVIQQDASGNFTLSLTDPTTLTKLAGALQDITDERSTVGAVDRRFEIAADTLTQRSTDLTKAISSIKDVDVAAESTQLTKLQTLSQSAAAILAQANQSPKSVLKLLA